MRERANKARRKAGDPPEKGRNGRMKGIEKKHTAARWLIPLIMVIPLIALVAFALTRWGGQIGDLFRVALKMVVVS